MLNKIARIFQKDYRGMHLEVQFKGGLCNKLHYLFSACDIAIKNETSIIEPEFGWKVGILFSDIYDLDFFNASMRKFSNNRDIIVKKNDSQNVIQNRINLWKYSEKQLKKERELGAIDINSTKVRVLLALKLKPELETIAKKFISSEIESAIQIRTESDWKRYAKGKRIIDPKESVYVSFEILLMLIKNEVNSKKIFFTSGENHQEIQNQLINEGFEVSHYFDLNLEYEIVAAINFEICCFAKYFLGNSRSSFSNLISLKRSLTLENESSYIYNYDNKIHRRIDKGLRPEALASISRETVITRNQFPKFSGNGG